MNGFEKIILVLALMWLAFASIRVIHQVSGRGLEIGDQP